MANSEGRIVLALQAYRLGQFKTIRSAARAYDVPYRTLYRRSRGTLARVDTTPCNRNLTDTEEYTLVKWILDMDTRGMPPTKALVQQMAELLLSERGQDASQPKPSIGKNWVSNFIKRHTELESKYNRKYDYQRAKCENPDTIRAWFRLVQNTIGKYGIQDEDIYNFDEAGFQLGVISTAKVITATERSRTVSIQPGNREWVTVIETISGSGWVLPSFIILKGKMHQASWYKVIPQEWTIGVSENGWTTDELGLLWLKQVFNKYTKDRTVGRYRLLILDGHGSHVTAEFDQYCSQHSIITLCMPAHSSHILQPLDVGCFSVLKRTYGQAVEGVMKTGINHIDKTDFLQLYQNAHSRTFHQNNIRSSFAATGLIPFKPDYVLEQLHVVLRTPTPPPQPFQQPLWIPETPHNIVELQHQTEAVKRLIRYRTQSPPSPTVGALNQLIKGCQLAMHSATLLAAENRDLRAANEKVKRKRATKKSYVGKGGVLTPADIQESSNMGVIAREVEVSEIGGVQDQPSERAPRKCSKCRSLLHTARTCQEP